MSNTAELLLNVAKHMKYQLNQALAATGGTAQQFALMQAISRLTAAQGKPPIAAQLTDELDMDKPTVAAILTRLRKKELVRRNLSPTDHRAYQLTLTARGQAELNRDVQTADEVLRAFLAPLPPAQQAKLAALLQQLMK